MYVSASVSCEVGCGGDTSTVRFDDLWRTLSTGKERGKANTHEEKRRYMLVDRCVAQKHRPLGVCELEREALLDSAW